MVQLIISNVKKSEIQIATSLILIFMTGNFFFNHDMIKLKRK